MARQILAHNSKIAKQWPHRALNFLTAAQLWKYLTWKSGGNASQAIFSLGPSLKKASRILILMPTTFQETLVLIPVLQSLKQELQSLEFLLLAPASQLPFLTALFGTQNTLEIEDGKIFWGDPYFNNLQKQVEDFKPDLSLDLGSQNSPLLAFLMRMAKAPFRVQLEAKYPRPFCNITLNPTEPENYLKAALLFPKLWNFTNNPLKIKWSRLKPSPEDIEEVHNRLESKGLKAASTELFLWQPSTRVDQQELLQKKVFEQKPQGAPLALAILVATGSPFSHLSPSPQITQAIPTLEIESTGLLLGLFDQSAQTVGTNGPLLHLASLTETQVEAHFNQEDAMYDTSFLNPKLKVIYSS